MKHAYRKYISTKLIHYRGDKTQREIADGIDLNIKTYQSYEEARAEPSLYILEKICSLHNISVDNLLYDSPFHLTQNLSSTNS